MTAEGIFPKIAGDIAYASEANKFARTTDWASGIQLSLSSGSGTALGCWNWTTTGSTYSVTDSNLSTYWAGSIFLPIGGAGSIVFDLGFDSYRNYIYFKGSGVSEFNGDGNFYIRSTDSTGSSYNITHLQIYGAGSVFDVTGSKIPIYSYYKTRNIVFYINSPGAAGSATFKFFDLKVV